MQPSSYTAHQDRGMPNASYCLSATIMACSQWRAATADVYYLFLVCVSTSTPASAQQAMSPKSAPRPTLTGTFPLILTVALSCLLLALQANGELSPLICPVGGENITREELCNETVFCPNGEDNRSTYLGEPCFRERSRCRARTWRRTTHGVLPRGARPLPPVRMWQWRGGSGLVIGVHGCVLMCTCVPP